MLRSLPLALLFAPILGASGCSGGPAAPFDPATLAPLDTEEAELLAAFAGAKLRFEGFATPEPGGEWREGDEVLFGVEYRRGREVERTVIGLRVVSVPFGRGRAMLHVVSEDLDGNRVPPGKEYVRFYLGAEFSLTLTDDAGKEWTFESGSILVEASTYDLAGKRLEREISVVAASFHAAGFHEACARFGGRFAETKSFSEFPPEEADAARQAYVHTFAALITLFRTLENNEAMAGILWRVVEKPSMLSVVMRGGVEVNLASKFEGIETESRPSPAVAPGTPLLRLPIEIQVNDRSALHASLVIAPSDCPIRTVAGVVAIDGRHPRDADRVVRLRLLASRRGPVPPPKPPESESDPAPAGEIPTEGILPIPQPVTPGDGSSARAR